MIRKLLGVFNIFLGFLILILPIFTELSYLKFVFPYLISVISFTIVLMIGFKYLFTYFLIFGFISITVVISNYYFSYELIFSFLLGVLGSVLNYFYLGSDSYE